METCYKDFITNEIEIRKSFFEERKHLISLEMNSKIPFYISERFEEIRIMALLGLDISIMKVIPVFVEYVLMNLNVAIELPKYNYNYKETLKHCEKLGLWEMIQNLKDKNAISKEDLDFYRMFNSRKYGGKELRNIEIHNKEAEKSDYYTIRKEIANSMNEEEVNVLETIAKNKNGLMQIAIRDMNARYVTEMIVGIHNFVNRNTPLLSQLQNV